MISIYNSILYFRSFFYVWGKCGENQEMKKPQLIDNQLRLYFESTQSRDRTGMEINPLVFETSASTNSAIWAIAVQKYAFFWDLQTIVRLKMDNFEIKIIR